MRFITNIDLARQAKLLLNTTANLEGSIDLGQNLSVSGEVSFSGLPLSQTTLQNALFLDENNKLKYQPINEIFIDDANLLSTKTWSSFKLNNEFESKSNKNVANGYAGLDSNGKLNQNLIPSLAISDTFTVTSESEMLGLSTAEKGDVAIRTDINKTFILKNGSPATLSNWSQILTPNDGIKTLSLTTPTGLSASPTSLSSSGTINITFSAGYSLPLTSKQGQWDTAYSNSHTHTNKSYLDSIDQSLNSSNIPTFSGVDIRTTGADQKGLTWSANTDYAKIYFESTSDEAGNSNLVFLSGDNFSSSGGPTEGFLFRKFNIDSEPDASIDIFKISPTELRYKTFSVYHEGNLDKLKTDLNYTGGGSGTVTKETLGLQNVDNTSDINKPISNPTLEALNGKAPVTGSNVYEVYSNKSTNTSLGTSNALYPSQNAVKSYVDNLDNGNVKTFGDQNISGIKTFSNLTLFNGDINTGTGVSLTIPIVKIRNSSGHMSTIENSSITANQTFTLPNKSGTVALTNDLVDIKQVGSTLEFRVGGVLLMKLDSTGLRLKSGIEVYPNNF